MTKAREKETKYQYSVMLKPSLVKEIDRIAEKLGLTRSQFMGNLIETALEDAKVMEKAGLFKAVIVSEKVMRKFKEYLFSGKITMDEKGELEIRK
jgi:metal-responsive CopG/Arc/MetJ family transcriptional regulator